MRGRQVLHYLVRFGLLTLAFALATMGLLGWQLDGFQWPAGPGARSDESITAMLGQLFKQPLVLLILGIAIVPPTLWDIFQLEMKTAASAGTSAATEPSADPVDTTPKASGHER